MALSRDSSDGRTVDCKSIGREFDSHSREMIKIISKTF